jgi:putative spermidine/putrescine transport system ATP-binding protein
MSPSTVRAAETSGDDGLARAAVSVRGVSMDYGSGAFAVRDASFDLAQGKFLTILGPSGSGKTTLLRMIAGFQRPTAGEILIDGQSVTRIAPHKRSIGMVFQRLALFPHMTAAQNIAFPLKMRRYDATTIDARVAEYLDLVRLGGLGGRHIHELSGGQQQRVAIARALVFEPSLLLLDEPLAALDRKLREDMQLEFRRIQRELGVTTINVTHDQREALVMSDEVIVMDGGRIQQMAHPVEAYRAPANPFVARFIGTTDFVSGRITSVSADGLALQSGNLSFRGLPASTSSRLRLGQHVAAAIRAEQIRVASEAGELAHLDTVTAGRIEDAIFEGERIVYIVAVPALDGLHLRAIDPAPALHTQLEPGKSVSLGWNSTDIRVYADETLNSQQSNLGETV